jgi:hypothetical protein
MRSSSRYLVDRVTLMTDLKINQARIYRLHYNRKYFVFVPITSSKGTRDGNLYSLYTYSAIGSLWRASLRALISMYNSE